MRTSSSVHVHVVCACGRRLCMCTSSVNVHVVCARARRLCMWTSSVHVHVLCERARRLCPCTSSVHADVVCGRGRNDQRTKIPSNSNAERFAGRTRGEAIAKRALRSSRLRGRSRCEGQLSISVEKPEAASECFVKANPTPTVSEGSANTIIDTSVVKAAIPRECNP